VDGDADGAGLVGEGPGHGLADPPGGVRGELVAARVVELLDRPDQAEVALLDEVEHGQAPADVPFGDGDDEAQVGLYQAAFGHPAHDDEPVEVQGELGVEVGGAGELLLGEQPGFDAAGQFDLLGGGQQRYAADLPEVLAEEVGGGAAAGSLGRGTAPGGGRLLRFVPVRYGVGQGLRVVRRDVLYGDGDGRGRGRVDVGQGLGLHGGDLQGDRCRIGGVRQRDGGGRAAVRRPVLDERIRGGEWHTVGGPAALRGLRHRPQCGVRHITASRGVRPLFATGR
jgi:hypothetical protein